MQNKCYKKSIVFGIVLMLMFVVFTPLLMNVRAELTEEWVARYNGPANYQDSARAIAIDPSSGNIYVTGISYGIGTNRDYATVAYDPDGNELWVARYNGPGNGFDIIDAIAVDLSSGNIYVTGISSGSGTGGDYATVAYDSSGNQLWVQRYSGPDNRDDRAHAIAVDPSSGNIYVTGYSRGSGTHEDYATVAYDSSGNQLWVQRYNGPGNYYDTAWAIAVDPSSGNIYISGKSGVGATTDYATVAYDSSGNQLWVQRYNGPGNSYDGTTAITVDISGNIYVTGESYGIGTNTDYATVAYDSDGNELWVARYNGPGNSYDCPIAVAVDISGNIYVTGYSRGSGTHEDYATVAYDSDGNELWVARYNGPGNGHDEASDVAVDSSSGNIYVTGQSYGIGTGGDYATVAYDSSGNQLWIQRYNGPGNYYDMAYAIAVDPSSGNIYVTGSSYGIGTNTDYATLKYPSAIKTAINIDIKPGSYPNSIKPKSKGEIPVAVLTTDKFDAITVNPDTVVFLSATPCKKEKLEDVDDDGDMDMLFHFKTQELDFSLLVDEGDEYPYAYLTGETIDGQLVEGKDTVRLVQPHQKQFETIFSRLFKRFPNLFPILQKMLLQRLGLQ